MTKEERIQCVVDGLIGVHEASQFLSVSRSTIYVLMGEGDLPFVKIGRSRRIPLRAVVEFAAVRLTGGSPDGE